LANRVKRLFATLGIATLLLCVVEQEGDQRTQSPREDSSTRGRTLGFRTGPAGVQPPLAVTPVVPSSVYMTGERMVTLEEGVDADAVARDLGLQWTSSIEGVGVHLFVGEEPALVALLDHPDVRSSVANGVMVGADDDDDDDDDDDNDDDDDDDDDDHAADDQALTDADLTDSVEASPPPVGPQPGELQWHLAGANTGPAPLHLDQVVVAVLDSGVAYRDWCGDGACEEGEVPTHRQAESLAHTPIVAPADFIDGDELPLDEHQHGTHIATTLLGDGAIQGVAPGASLMPVRVLDETNTGSEFSLVQGIVHALDHNADIINLSLSFQPDFVPSPHLLEVLKQAHEEGVLVVAAAGNLGMDRSSWPAVSPLVVSVGASAPESDYGALSNREKTTGIAHLAPYSNAAPTVDVVAPGGDLSTDVTGDGHPDGILAETIHGGDPSQTGYFFFEGTSQATAIVSGAAARAIALGATADEAMFALQAPARELRGEGALDGVGSGYLDISRTERAVERGRRALSLNRDVRVSMLPYLERGSDGRVRPVARLTAIGAVGRSGHEVWLNAHITHRGVTTPVDCWTHPETGVCEVTGEWVSPNDVAGEAWTVRMTGLHYPEGVIARPTGVVFATDGLEAILQAADSHDVLPESFGLGLFWEEGTDSELGSTAASFAFFSGGTGLATSPMGVIATPAAMFPGVLEDSSTGTGLATSPLGFHTLNLADALLTSGTGLATSPLGVIHIDLADLGGAGLATSPLGFTSITFTPTDLDLDGTGLAMSPLGWAPMGTFELGGLSADGSTTTLVTLDGTGLAMSPLGLHGADLLMPGGGGADLCGVSFQDGVPLYDAVGASTEAFSDSVFGDVVEDGGFVDASGRDAGALLGARSLSAATAGSQAGPPVYFGPAR